jgi:hypothetical protein
MKRICILLALTLSGCSTHPLADVLDNFQPGRFGKNEVQPYGGVCIPQGPVLPPSNLPVIVPGPISGPPAGVIPPPVPLPSAIPVPTPPITDGVPPPPIYPRPGL